LTQRLISGAAEPHARAVFTAYSLTFLFVVTPVLFWFVGRSGPVRSIDFHRTIAPIALASLSALAVQLAWRLYVPIAVPLVGMLSCLLIALATTILVLLMIPGGRKVLLDFRPLVIVLIRGVSPSEDGVGGTK